MKHCYNFYLMQVFYLNFEKLLQFSPNLTPEPFGIVIDLSAAGLTG